MSIKEMDWKRSIGQRLLDLMQAYSFIVVCNRDDSICCNKIWDIFRRFYSIFRGTMNGIRQSCKWIVGVAKALAQVGDRIPNEMIAIIVHWLFLL